MTLLATLLACAALCNPVSPEAPPSDPLSETTLDLRIPVVDMHDYLSPAKREQFLDTLYHALCDVGFFAVRNTGVSKETIDNAYAESQRFFKQDDAYKRQYYFLNLRGQRGFVPGETAKGGKNKDVKEFYLVGRDLPEEELKQWGLYQNVWTDRPQFQHEMTNLYNGLDRYVDLLCEALVEVINRKASDHLPSDFFSQMVRRGDSLLRVIYYPALSEGQVNNEELYWAGPHTDIDLLAILPRATERGLQVEVDGQWLTVVTPDDTFIVNGGDMLRNLTNGLFKSARHRVKALEPGKDRFSMVLFVHPTSDTPLDPLPSCIELSGGVQTYAPGTRLEFLLERLLEIGIAPDALLPYSKTGHTERQMQFGKASPQVIDLLVKNNLASEELLNALK